MAATRRCHSRMKKLQAGDHTVPASEIGLNIPQKGSLGKCRTCHNIICYGDINFFFLRNLDNPEQDILIAEVDFQNLKGRLESTDE